MPRSHADLNSRDESYPNFLVEDFQDLSTGTAFQQLTMVPQTLDGLSATICRTKFKRSIIRRVIFTRLGQGENDVLDLHDAIEFWE
jgi:hypothetical protein